jgi:2-hydroxy-6-oxonona-2,4-dienedioate hydrolase
MDALGIEKAALVGNSMGGITAIRLTVVHPDRVSHLITMGSGSTRAPKLFSPGDGPTEGIKVLQLCYREPTFENMKLLCEIMMFDPGDRVDALAQERLESATAHPEHLANFLDALVKGGGPIRQWYTAEDLMAITTPTLLFHGRDDRVVPYEHSLLLLAHIPDSRLHLFNRCGHWAMIEHPAEFNRDVIDFIQNN